MAEGKSLKEQNVWLIRAAMSSHVLAFVWVAAEPMKLLSANRAALAEQLGTFAAPGTAGLGLIMIASLLLLGFVPPKWRDRLMHWHWKDPLPGSRLPAPMSICVDYEKSTAYSPEPATSRMRCSTGFIVTIETILACSMRMAAIWLHETSEPSRPYFQ